MRNPLKTGRLVTDRLIWKTSVLCTVFLATAIPLFTVYISLRNGCQRHNDLAEQTRRRALKVLERSDVRMDEVVSVKNKLSNALSIASRLENLDDNELNGLWESCKRDVDCKRKDSLDRAQELTSSVMSARNAYQKAVDQLKAIKSYIEVDARARSEQIEAVKTDQCKKLNLAIESLKSELKRPMLVNKVSVSEYLKSRLGIVTIKGDEEIRKLKSNCLDVERILMDVGRTRKEAEMLSQRLDDAREKIKNQLNEMKKQKQAGCNAYKDFAALPLDPRRAMASFRQKHINSLAVETGELNERFLTLIGEWKTDVCQESVGRINLASNSIDTAEAFVMENRNELSESAIKSLDLPKARVNDCISALSKRIGDSVIEQNAETISKQLENLKNSLGFLEEEFEKVEKIEEVNEDVSRVLIDRVGMVRTEADDVSAEIIKLGQRVCEVRDGELNALVAMTQELNDSIARVAEAMPKVEYEAGFLATCIPVRNKKGIGDSDIETMMNGRYGEVLAGYNRGVSFSRLKLESDAKNDFTAYRALRFDFSLKGAEIGELKSLVLKLSKNAQTLRKGSNRGIPGKLKVNFRLKVKGIELSQNASAEKDCIDKNRSDSLRIVIPLVGSRQLMRHASFSLLVWISPYRETGWDYSGLSAEVYGVNESGGKTFSLLHEAIR